MDDVLVVGEALVDIVEGLDGSRAEHPGGSPANVALGLGRLGRRVSLLTKVGQDARGEAIRQLLEASEVRLVPASITAAPTSTATARLDERGVARYEFDLDWRLPPDLDGVVDLGQAKALHTGSIAAFLAPGGDAVLDLVQRAAGRLTVTYDPNARPRLMGDPVRARRRVELFVQAAGVVKVSDEDLDWLAPGEDPVDVAASWLRLGPALVVVTRGARGATGLCAAGRAEVSAPPITIVDTVGAGDAFMSGLLDHLAGSALLGADRVGALTAIPLGQLEATLRHAVQVAAFTCGRAGADPPTRAELQAVSSS